MNQSMTIMMIQPNGKRGRRPAAPDPPGPAPGTGGAAAHGRYPCYMMLHQNTEFEIPE